MDREQKTAVVEELATELKDSAAIFAVDYRGISVPQAAELRASLRDADTRFRVVKNRLTLRAADEAGTDGLKDLLSGPTALALVKGDAALAAKTLNRLGSEWELLAYKGGLMDGEALDPDTFVAIARLPGREMLNAQLAGTVASPLTGLVRGLGSMIQGLAMQLGQIAEQGLVTGGARGGEPARKRPRRMVRPQPPPIPKVPVMRPAAARTRLLVAKPMPRQRRRRPDPEPAESPEETSEEEAPEGEDAGQDEAAETGEGDADIGEEPAQEETSEDSDENKEDSE